MRQNLFDVENSLHRKFQREFRVALSLSLYPSLKGMSVCVSWGNNKAIAQAVSKGTFNWQKNTKAKVQVLSFYLWFQFIRYF